MLLYLLVRSEIISLRAERDKLVLEANFARERLDRLMKEFEHQVNSLLFIFSFFLPMRIGMPVVSFYLYIWGYLFSRLC